MGEEKVKKEEEKKERKKNREGGGKEEGEEEKVRRRWRKWRSEEMDDLYLRDSYGGLSRSLNLHAPPVPHSLGPADVHVDQQQVGVVEVKVTVLPRVSETDTQELLDLPVRGKGGGGRRERRGQRGWGNV